MEHTTVWPAEASCFSVATTCSKFNGCCFRVVQGFK
jgi:hypothetical protein